MPNRPRTAVALRHVAFEDLGLLAPILDAAGWRVSYCEAATDNLAHASIADADLLIVLGGPIGVGDAARYPFLALEIALIERRLAAKRPTLGICLGAQLMAAALGARVYPGAAKEIGWAPVKLTADGRRSALAALEAGDGQVLHWHGDTFDLPEGAKRLASTKLTANQAFSYGRNALALQFHLEASCSQLEEWYVGHAVELAAAGVSIEALRSDSERFAPAGSETARAVLTSWLNDLSIVRRDERIRAMAS